jgi:DNA mismatch endonuclease (patch repair protein)
LLRDRLVTKTLRQQGWRVLRIWEHDLTKNADRCIKKIKDLLLRGPLE